VYTTESDYKTKTVRNDNGIYKNDDEKLTFKVAKIEGFSLFCNWDQVDEPEHGKIDEDRFHRDKTYLKEILEYQFS
jgi:hypothetical protein